MVRAAAESSSQQRGRLLVMDGASLEIFWRDSEQEIAEEEVLWGLCRKYWEDRGGVGG